VSLRTLSLLACLILVACAQTPTSSSEREGSRTTEELHVPPYPSETPWKELSNRRNDRIHMIEWIPSDQYAPNVEDVLTAQTFYAQRATPSHFLRGVMVLTVKACERVKVNGPKEQTEDSYPVAYAQIYCGRQKGTDKDVVMFLKAIGGKDALYVVQREFRRPARAGSEPGMKTFSTRADATAWAEALKTANDHLKSVYLCPPSGGSERCTTRSPMSR
jgi:hypothetical protein